MNKVLKALVEAGLEAFAPGVGKLAAKVTAAGTEQLLDSREEAKAKDLAGRLLERLEESVSAWRDAEGVDAGAIEAGLELAERIAASPQEFLGAWSEARFDPRRAAERSVAATIASDASMQGLERDACLAVLTALFAGLASESDALEATEGSFRRSVLTIGDKVDELAAAAARQHALLQGQIQLLVAFQEKGKVGLGPTQLDPDTVFALACRLRPDELLDFDQAVKELDYVIAVTLEVRARGGYHVGEQDRFITDVMDRVAELTAAGRLEQGADSINEALAKLDRRMVEQRERDRRHRTTLLERLIGQAVMLRDAERVADAVLALAMLSDEARPASSRTFRDRLEAFYVEGRDKGVNFALEVAVRLSKLRCSGAQDHNEKREALNWLGISLLELGGRDGGTARLYEAVAAFRETLKELSQERVPLEWARRQINLGAALVTLGERESGTARLEEAVTAYREALKELTQKRVPLDWATTQNNLGNALTKLSERQSGTARLEEAVTAYREALKELTQEGDPLGWAMTQTNLGGALAMLGEREGGTARLYEAVAAHREALKENTRMRVPLDWAGTQYNLGNALMTLGERESGTARLDEAVTAYREALEEQTQERVPLDWAGTQNNLGSALTKLSERQSGTARLEEAVTAYREALKVHTQERVPLKWAMTQTNLGGALHMLGVREGGTARLYEAVKAFREALKERTQQRVPLEWAGTQNNLGAALATLGERESGTARLEDAVTAYREALKEYTQEREPLKWATTQNNLNEALFTVASR